MIVGFWSSGDGILSVQVLQAFYVNVTRELKRPLSSSKARAIVGEYLTWRVVENTGSMLLSAIDLQQRAQLSFWDALVIQAAIDADCDRLCSEDLNAGQRFGSLQVINPFASPRAPSSGHP